MSKAAQTPEGTDYYSHFPSHIWGASIIIPGEGVTNFAGLDPESQVRLRARMRELGLWVDSETSPLSEQIPQSSDTHIA